MYKISSTFCWEEYFFIELPCGSIFILYSLPSVCVWSIANIILLRYIKFWNQIMLLQLCSAIGVLRFFSSSFNFTIHFHYPRTSLSLFLLWQPLRTPVCFSIILCFPECYIHGIIQYATLYVWPISLSIMLLRVPLCCTYQ